MHPEIEKLIELALADGQITEKERAVIIKKATEFGVDQDEVEMTLDAKLHQLQVVQITPIKEKNGNIKTCPACGAHVKAFQIKCDDCGHEFRDTNASKSIISFYEELKNKSLQDQSIIVSSYPIPSNKEDILEFLSISVGNCKRLDNEERMAYSTSVWGGKFSSDLGFRESLINAWQGKTIQAINKGKTLFKNDSILLSEITRYEKQYIEISSDPKLVAQGKIKKIAMVSVILIIVLSFIMAYLGSSESDEKKLEQQKLDNIENQIVKSINQKKYDNALILNEQLVWSWQLNYTESKKKALQYDEKRKSYKATIEKMKIK